MKTILIPNYNSLILIQPVLNLNHDEDTRKDCKNKNILTLEEKETQKFSVISLMGSERVKWDSNQNALDTK